MLISLWWLYVWHKSNCLSPIQFLSSWTLAVIFPQFLFLYHRGPKWLQEEGLSWDKKPCFPILPLVSSPQCPTLRVFEFFDRGYQYSFIWADFLHFYPTSTVTSVSRHPCQNTTGWVAYITRNEFSLCSETGSSRSKCLSNEDYSRASSWLTKQPAQCAHMAFSLWKKAQCPSSSYRDTDAVGLGPHLMTSFNLTTSLKGPEIPLR